MMMVNIKTFLSWIWKLEICLMRSVTLVKYSQPRWISKSYPFIRSLCCISLPNKDFVLPTINPTYCIEGNSRFLLYIMVKILSFLFRIYSLEKNVNILVYVDISKTLTYLSPLPHSFFVNIANSNPYFLHHNVLTIRENSAIASRPVRKASFLYRPKTCGRHSHKYCNSERPYLYSYYGSVKTLAYATNTQNVNNSSPSAISSLHRLVRELECRFCSEICRFWYGNRIKVRLGWERSLSPYKPE